jgi:hypothetical protein
LTVGGVDQVYSSTTRPPTNRYVSSAIGSSPRVAIHRPCSVSLMTGK